MGQDILKLYDHFRFNFDVSRPSMCTNTLKGIKANVVPRLFEHLASVDKSGPFTLETDASDVAISAVLQQNDRLLAFG